MLVCPQKCLLYLYYRTYFNLLRPFFFYLNIAKPNLSKLNREVLESRKDRYKAFARVKERKNKKDRRLMVLLDERMKVEWERREILKSRIL